MPIYDQGEYTLSLEGFEGWNISILFFKMFKKNLIILILKKMIKFQLAKKEMNLILKLK
jgi:hypothetical protein